jgi:Arc/MetJ-type ribon-helix-helix transcriptional regulator
MPVQIAADIARMIQENVAAGCYNNSDEVLREFLARA